MFDELATLAASRGLVLTCYVDDITITGSASASYETLAQVRRIIADYELRSHRVRRFDRHQPRIITGVVVTSKGIALPNRRSLKIKQ